MAATDATLAAVTINSSGWTKVGTIAVDPTNFVSLTIKPTFPASPAANINWILRAASKASPTDSTDIDSVDSPWNAGQILNSNTPPRNYTTSLMGVRTVELWAMMDVADSSNPSGYSVAADYSYA